MTFKKPPFSAFKNSVFLKAAKTSNFIYQIGKYPELRRSSRLVSITKIPSKEMQDKFKYLKECLMKYRRITGYGRGITAVQIGMLECFSVVYTPEKLIILVNPKITKKSKKLLKYPEICMSANPIIAPVIRPSWIEFEYYDETGKKQKWNNHDDKILNRVFQHEIDHMNGIINIDLVDSKELILESDPDFYKNAKFEKVSI